LWRPALGAPEFRFSHFEFRLFSCTWVSRFSIFQFRLSSRSSLVTRHPPRNLISLIIFDSAIVEAVTEP
jgi:hypothetical protein